MKNGENIMLTVIDDAFLYYLLNASSRYCPDRNACIIKQYKVFRKMWAKGSIHCVETNTLLVSIMVLRIYREFLLRRYGPESEAYKRRGDIGMIIYLKLDIYQIDEVLKSLSSIVKERNQNERHS